MKRLCFVIALCFATVFGLQLIEAANTIPTGKNILNPERIVVEETGIWTHTPLKVEAETLYTLTIPNSSLIRDVHITIRQDGIDILSEGNNEHDVCKAGTGVTICTFQTLPDQTYLDLDLYTNSNDLHYYISVYGFDYFQLEVGPNSTDYVPYSGVVDGDPYFQGEGTLITSYETTLLLSQIIGEFITAYDDIDGDLTDDIIVTSDAYSGFENTVGSYTVHLEVSDSSFNTTVFHLEIIVKDEVPPVVSGPSVVYIDVDNPLNIAFILSAYFDFYDAYDGVIIDYIIIEDNYTGFESVLGLKEITFTVKDAAENTTQMSFNIDVYDDVSPNIEGPSVIEWVLSEQYSLDDVLMYYTVSDNHTDAEALDFYIKSHTLPIGFNETGIFTVVLEAVDASQNTTERTIQVTIKDDIPPVIEGPYTVQTSYETILSMSSIIALLSVSDNYVTLTLEDIVVVEDLYTDAIHDVGIYKIIFSVSDGENETFHTIDIDVIDDVPPRFHFDARVLLEMGSTLSTDDMLVVLLKEEDVKSFNPTTVEVVTKSENDGDHLYTLLLSNEANETLEKTLLIEVINPVYKPERSIASLSGLMVASVVIITGLYMFKKLRK